MREIITIATHQREMLVDITDLVKQVANNNVLPVHQATLVTKGSRQN